MMIYRSKEKFSTRLTMEGATLERAQEMIHLGVWLTEDLTWDKHISEICKISYPRIKMLSKLKFVRSFTYTACT